MAPSKSARNAHEEKVEGKEKEKPSVPNGTQSGTKMRRGASQANHARDQAAVTAAPQPPPAVVQETAGVSRTNCRLLLDSAFHARICADPEPTSHLF